MTKDKAVKYHREMWNWIADTIETDMRLHSISYLKSSWCSAYGISIEMDCFACEYDSRCGIHPCKNCLFNWGDTKDFTPCSCGYFKQCLCAKTWQEQAKLARKIANLPVREEV